MNNISENEKKFIISTSPHTHSGDTVRKIMLAVLLALVPAFVVAVLRFGWDAIRLVVVCVSASVISEVISRKIMHRDIAIDDCSALVTGVLLAFNLPPSLPSWMAVAGTVFAIVIAKQLFGGLGYNLFNPALIGRVFLLISFTQYMTTWSSWYIPQLDTITTATPLGMVKTSLVSTGQLPLKFDNRMMLDFFLGLNKNGCIGEISALALFIGGIYLLYRRCIYWQVPVFFISSVALFSGILWIIDPVHNMNPLFHILTGGVFLGAFFMATDMVTSPVTSAGMAIFGAGCGILTMIIRKWGGYPEGVSFAILLMNSVTPLINLATKPRIFGYKGRHK